jgi:hypothetical protein
LWPQLSVGEIILLNEYKSKDSTGKTKAVDEFLKKNAGFEKIITKGCVQPNFGIKKI